LPVPVNRDRSESAGQASDQPILSMRRASAGMKQRCLEGSEGLPSNSVPLLLAARETVKDLEAMAHGMRRAANTRAATAYSIDPHSAARAVGLSERPASIAAEPQAAASAKEATTERGERLRQCEDRQAREEITRDRRRQREERDHERKGRGWER